MKARLFTVTALTLLTAQLVAAQTPLDGVFYAWDAFKGLFNNATAERVASAGDPEQRLALYRDLYVLKTARASFMDALSDYVGCVEAGKSLFERDMRMSDVGIASARVIDLLSVVQGDLKKLGADLSLSNPAIDTALQTYLSRNSLIVGRRILREHELNTSNLEDLRAVVKRAAENGKLLSDTVDNLRLAIATKDPGIPIAASAASGWQR